MRSTSLATALLLCMPALAGEEPSEKVCTFKLNSAYRLSAPAGWRFVECASGVHDQNRNFSLAPLDPAVTGITMYGGPVGRGTVEGVLASDRETHAPDFVPNDADELRTADGRDVRVLQLTSRGEPYTWLAHGYAGMGPVVFWLAFECKDREQCAARYPAFKKLAGSLHLLQPNEVNRR